MALKSSVRLGEGREVGALGEGGGGVKRTCASARLAESKTKLHTSINLAHCVGMDILYLSSEESMAGENVRVKET